MNTISKKGMKQNHSRKAEETKAQIRKLTLEDKKTARQICDELELGYSTVMKYRKEVLDEEEKRILREKQVQKREAKLNRGSHTFRIKDYSFEVGTFEKNNNTLFNLDDIKKGVKEYTKVNIEECVRKSIENGGEFIFGSYLIPIANKIKDFYFTQSVQEALFVPSIDQNYLHVANLFEILQEFLTSSSELEREESHKLQNELLKALDTSTDIQELTSITSKLKKARIKIMSIDREDDLRVFLKTTLAETNLNIDALVEKIKNKDF